MPESADASRVKIDHWPGLGFVRYSALIATLGYEERAQFVASQVKGDADLLIAIDYESFGDLDYDQNARWFRSLGFQFVRPGNIRDFVRDLAIRQSERLEPCHILVDISCMTRETMADLLSGLWIANGRPLVVDIVYAPAVFQAPPVSREPIERSGPVTHELAGWTEHSERPLTAAIGLGYEPEKAMGTVEYLEVSQSTWAFIPTGNDPRYDAAVSKANHFFLAGLPSEHHLRYSIGRPLELVASLESLVFGLVKKSRPILVPLGPKIFAAACCLVGYQHWPDVAVWRVTSGHHAVPRQSVADGTMTGLRVSFGASAGYPWQP